MDAVMNFSLRTIRLYNNKRQKSTRTSEHPSRVYEKQDVAPFFTLSSLLIYNHIALLPLDKQIDLSYTPKREHES
jgi:hypothetical protein